MGAEFLTDEKNPVKTGGPTDRSEGGELGIVEGGALGYGLNMGVVVGW